MLWLIPHLEQFPRSQKFLLGDRLQAQALAVLDSLIIATYTKDRGPYLRQANLCIEQLRFGIRLARDLKHMDLRRYEFAGKSLDQIGRMVGSWNKASSTTAKPAAVAVKTEQTSACR